jgi:hypothetical protein
MTDEQDISGGEDTKIIYKSSVTGKIVSKEFAEKHPRTTSSMEVPENANLEDYEDEGDPNIVEDPSEESEPESEE